MKQLSIGIAGLGTVGGGVWHHFHRNAELLRQRTGVELSIDRVAVRDLQKPRSVEISPQKITGNWRELVEDPRIGLVVELMGGITEAGDLIRAALENGKHVVTANKALLAAQGRDLFELAVRKKRHLLFEASVAGGIPIIKALSEGLVANRILSLHGIINGTCNYILTRMSEGGEEYSTVLADAKRLGYAEADESLDVDGHDAAHKAAVLAALAYGVWVTEKELHTEGIRHVERQDLQFAKTLGYELKLLAIIKCDETGAVEVRVHPTFVPLKHVLASVSGVFNAVAVQGDIVGDTLFYGRGAGADATASAVLGDIAEVARDHFESERCYRPHGVLTAQRVKSIDEVISRHYVRLSVADRPGVLAQVATVLAAHRIGISSVIQPESQAHDYVPLIIMVHDAAEKEMKVALAEIEKLPVVRQPAIRIRVEDFV